MNVGLVLSGGGARGAYEAGALQGLVEVLGARRDGPPLFQVVAGTSVGAINGAWVAANAHRGDHHVQELTRLWQTLDLREHLRVDLLSLVGWTSPLRFFGRKSAQQPIPERMGQSVLDPSALEALVQGHLDFGQLHANVAQGRVRALVVAALHIATGVTTMFAECAPGATFHPIRHPRRAARLEHITAEHVLASAAIPALFPARRVGTTYFCDGGLRFNTPIAPAIRAGADKLVVVTLRYDAPLAHEDFEAALGAAEEGYPNAVFFLGKILNALLLDPVAYDLQVLERFNRLIEVLERTLPAHELATVARVLEETRGLPYRKLQTLVLTPSQNIGVLAGQYLRDTLPAWKLGRFYEWLLSRAAHTDSTWEADFASYFLFDGGWASRLLELGRQDAHRQAEAIRAFHAT